MSLNLLVVRAGVADSCAEIAGPCVCEPLLDDLFNSDTEDEDFNGF